MKKIDQMIEEVTDEVEASDLLAEMKLVEFTPQGLLNSGRTQEAVNATEDVIAHVNDLVYGLWLKHSESEKGSALLADVDRLSGALTHLREVYVAQKGARRSA